MKDTRFIKKWKKERRHGKIIYLLKFNFAYILGILIADFFLFEASNIIGPFNSQDLITNFSVFAGFSIATYFKWEKNEERYNQLIENKPHKKK
ncbi:MAG TPA: hypothetical protein PKA19_00030 [Bacillota bacterium]|nr:hypothetical protein [Bacillota bacterium]